MASTSSGGIGFFGALTLIFIVLKLTGLIKWSWFWILSPIWIGLGITVVILIILAGAIFLAVPKRGRRHR